MKRLLFVIVLFAIFSIGSAHKPAPFSFASAGISSYQNHETEPFVIKEIAQKQTAVEQESPDDDLDLSDEEDEEEVVEVADPIFYWNTAMYHFNDKFYFWVLKPVAKKYEKVVPEGVRTGVKNFFHNLVFPIRFVGCILQGKGSAAVGEFGRFTMNSTAGIAGFINVVKDKPHLNPPEEDLGQAFGRWGIGNGFYIVWPLLGPSTLRDSVGLAGEYFLNPVSYVKPFYAYAGIRAYDTVNKTSFKIGDYESLIEGAIDPYLAIRDAYIQHRIEKIEDEDEDEE